MKEKKSADAAASSPQKRNSPGLSRREVLRHSLGLAVVAPAGPLIAPLVPSHLPTQPPPGSIQPGPALPIPSPTTHWLFTELVVENQRYAIKIITVVPERTKPLFVEISELVDDEPFYLMEAIGNGSSTMTVPVSSWGVPDGRKYLILLVNENSQVLPSGPRQVVDVPSYAVAAFS